MSAIGPIYQIQLERAIVSGGGGLLHNKRSTDHLDFRKFNISLTLLLYPLSERL